MLASARAVGGCHRPRGRVTIRRKRPGRQVSVNTDTDTDTDTDIVTEQAPRELISSMSPSLAIAPRLWFSPINVLISFQSREESPGDVTHGQPWGLLSVRFASRSPVIPGCVALCLAE